MSTLKNIQLNLSIFFSLLFSIFITPKNAFSQVFISADLNGVITTGTALTVGNAFFEINNGIYQGQITLSVSDNIIETNTCVLHESGGSSNYSQIDIYVNNGMNYTISGTMPDGEALIELDGADNVSIEGFGNLSFVNDNSSAVTGTCTIKVHNDAQNFTINQCTVLGASQTDFNDAGGTIFLGDGISTGNTFANINNCKIGAAGSFFPSKAIFSKNTVNSNKITVNNCEIYDYFSENKPSAGIVFEEGNQSSLITNNKFYQTSTKTLVNSNPITHYGIKINADVAGTGFTIQDNVIGFANNLGSGNYTLSSASPYHFIGIDFNATSNVINNVLKNTVANISLTGVNNLNAIKCNATASNVGFNFNNTSIKDINVATSINSNATGIELLNATTASYDDVEIRDIHATSSALVTGIKSSATNQFFNRCNINDLSSNYNVTGLWALGANGTSDIKNCIIGALSTNGNNLVGIKIESATTNLHYNTVQISGTGSNGLFSSATLSAGVTSNILLINNLFVNNTIPQGGGITTVIERIGPYSPLFYNTSSNNNCFYAGTPNANHLIFYNGITNYQTLADYKAAMVNRDQNSISENSPFLSTNPNINPSNFLHINTNIPSGVSNAGKVVTIITDYDNDNRDAATPDIGADEFTLACIAATQPIITSNATATCPGLSITLSLTGTLNSATDWKWYSSSCGGILEGTGNSITVTPTMTTTYFARGEGTVFCQEGSCGQITIIVATLSGTYQIGASQPAPFNTLTNAINNYNNSCLGGAVVFELIDGDYSANETFPITINRNGYANTTNSLTIKPAVGMSPQIGGSFKLNAAKYITIDGSNITNGTSRNLTIDFGNSPSNYPATVWLASTTIIGNENITLKNTNFLGKYSAEQPCVMLSGIAPWESANFPNNSIAILNNLLKKSTDGIRVYGDAAGLQTGLIIKDNTIGSTIPTERILLEGIYVIRQKNILIEKNYILEIKSLSTPVSCIHLQGSVQNATIISNKITNYHSFSTSTAININSVTGLNDNVDITIANNVVSDDALAEIGINISNASDVKVYYNSVRLYHQDSTSYSENFSALKIGIDVSNLDIRNNLFSIEGNPSYGGKIYTVYSLSSSSAFTHFDYNNFYAKNAYFLLPRLGYINGIKCNNILEFRNAFGNNLHSKNYKPHFISSSDLHLQAAKNAAFDNAATPLSITTDFDGNIRNATLPDMGAFEFSCAANTADVPVITASKVNNICPGQTIILSVVSGELNGSQDWYWYANSCGGTAVGQGSHIVVNPNVSTIYYVRAEGGCNPIGICTAYAVNIYAMNGTYQIGASQPFPFNTLTNAINRLNVACLLGHVTYELIDANYSNNETFPIVIDSTTVTSLNQTLTILPSSGNSTEIVSNDAGLLFSYSNYIRIKNIIFKNNYAGGNNRYIIGMKDCNNNKVENCQLIGNSSTGVNYGIHTENADQTEIIGNTFKKMSIAIYCLGSPYIFIENNTIGSSVVSEYIRSGGIYLNNSTLANIQSNTIFNTVSSQNYAFGIDVHSCENVTIKQNTINNIVVTEMNAASISLGMKIQYTDDLIVENNMVSNIKGGSGISPFGIYIFEVISSFNFNHNTIALGGALIGSSINEACAAIVLHNISSITNIKNNIFSNTYQNSNLPTVKNIAILTSFSSLLPNFDYNIYHASGNYPYLSGQFGTQGQITATYSTLSQLQANLGGNQNSLNIQPNFISNDNLHLDPDMSHCISNKGTPIATILTDIDNQSRNITNPDIGADEFDATSSLLTPSGSSQFCKISSISSNTSMDFTDPNCKLVATITSIGTNPIVGSIATCVKMATAITIYQNKPYLQRQYDIEPSNNPITATASLKLYYLQSEFDAYNTYVTTNSLGLPLMPTGGVDNGNFKITQCHGTGTAIGNYTGSSMLIIPTLTWNSMSNWWEATFSINGFSGFFAHTGTALLPVRLVTFDGTAFDKFNLLTWKTEIEENISHFELEKSDNGNQNWVKIGEIEANSSSIQGENYEFNDKLPFSISYYRLKMVDKDGRFEHSKSIALAQNYTKISLLEVFPNPTDDFINITFFAPEFQEVDFFIQNINGQNIKEFNQDANKGLNSFTIPVSEIPNGIYFLKLKNNESFISKKFIKK